MIKETKWRGGLNVPSGSGKRLIINHLGSKNGFVDSCGECFVGKKDSGDYHNEMNFTHFERWWESKVLPSLPDKSVMLSIIVAKQKTLKNPQSRGENTQLKIG